MVSYFSFLSSLCPRRLSPKAIQITINCKFWVCRSQQKVHPQVQNIVICSSIEKSLFYPKLKLEYLEIIFPFCLCPMQRMKGNWQKNWMQVVDIIFPFNLFSMMIFLECWDVKELANYTISQFQIFFLQACANAQWYVVSSRFSLLNMFYVNKDVQIGPWKLW